MSAQRTAVITGATSERGIGIDVARRYAREGWAVVVLDLDAEKSAKVAADIANQFGVPAFGYAVDVTSEESVAAAHEAVAQEARSAELRNERADFSLDIVAMECGEVGRRPAGYLGAELAVAGVEERPVEPVSHP